MDQRPKQPAPLSKRAPPDRAHLLTERRNPRSMNLDALTVEQCVALINSEDATVPAAVARAQPAICAFINDALPRLRAGGRLVYVGAGTSGRLGVLDASECPPTFQSPPGMVVGVIAGGDAALRRSSEGREDDPNGAHDELAALNINNNDSVLGVAAGGTTPYVLGALRFAHQRGALTGLLVCAPIERPPGANHLILVETGPEVLTGSTRMKAGTATKLVLNTISTTCMVRLGKAYENLMVDVRAANDKLRDRAARIVAELTGTARDDALALLDHADGCVKAAVLMHARALTLEQAQRALADARGVLRDALHNAPPAQGDAR